MKRDMDLVRCILIQVEGADGPVPLDALTCGRWSVPEVDYHVRMMAAHGLVDATLHEGYHGTTIMGTVDGLTWDGADYLDAIRDDGIWQKTKRVIADAVGSTTLSVIRDAACLVATQAIRAHLGIR